MFERFIAAWLLLLVVADGLISTLFSANIPQPLSCALFAVGLWLFDLGAQRAAWRFARWPIVVAVFWLAFYVNLLLVFLVVPMSSIICLWRPGGPGAIGRPTELAMILIAAMAAFLQSRLSEPHTPTVLNPFWNALADAATSAMSGINPSTRFGLLLAVSATAILAYRPKPGAPAAVSVPHTHLVAIAVLRVTAGSSPTSCGSR